MIHCGFFQFVLKSGKCLAPKPVQVIAQKVEPIRIQPVQPPVPNRLIHHEIRILQDLQVLGNGRAAYGKTMRQIADGARTLEQPVDNRPARGIPQRIQL